MTQPSKAAKKHPGRSGAGFGILLSLLIASAAAIASYWTWQQSNIRDEVQDDLEKGVSQLLGAIDKQRVEINNHFKIEQQLEHKYNLLQQQLISLESKFEQANQPLKANRWSVAEVIYLINIAEHHYRLGRNTTMAHTALEQARELLLEHDSTNRTSVIEGISQLLVLLEGDSGTSQAQQIKQLDALYKLIPTLPVARNTLTVDQSSSDGDFSLHSIEGWRHYGEALKHDIQQLIRISRPDDPDSEKSQPITADIYPLIRQQLALKIDLIRIALMSNSPIYITTAKDALGLLDSFFDHDSEVIRIQRTVLEQIVATGERELPDINFESIRQQLASSSGE